MTSPKLKEISIHISLITRHTTPIAVTVTALTQYHKNPLRINFYNSRIPSSQSSRTLAEMKGLFFRSPHSDVPHLRVSSTVMLSNLSLEIHTIGKNKRKSLNRFVFCQTKHDRLRAHIFLQVMT